MIFYKTPSKAFSSLTMALLSGLLLFLSFPKFGNGILAWVALLPLLHALNNAEPREGFKIGFVTGLIAHVGIIYWIPHVVVQYGYLPFYVGIAAMLLLAAYLSLYTACFAMGVIFLRTSGKAVFLTAPLLWTVLEYARSHLLTGFPWETLACSQYLSGNIIQIADVTGIYGISFTIVLINAVLYNVLTAGFRGSRYAVAEIATACAVFAIIYGYGHFRAAEIYEALKKVSPVEVALIQGNIDQNMKWDARYQLETLDIYRFLSLMTIPAQRGFIVWPETAAPFYFERSDPLRAVVVDVARTSGRTLLFGSPRYEEENGAAFYMNSAYLLRTDGVIGGRYDKVHLVPYGEYVPLRKLFPFIGKLVPGVGDFRSGKGFDPIVSDGHRLGVLICYEGIFPQAARDYKRNGADLLVNITNDAWFGRTSAPHQHLSMTVFRAVENRLYLVRAANTGISAVIDPTGVIVSRTGVFERTVLKGEVKFIDEKTFYAAYGDVFVYLCGLLLILNCFFKKGRMNHA
jgi:apolipoprotein N-acyltransferase